MMTPTATIDPFQRIDQKYVGDVLVDEIIHNYPPDGGGTHRWEDGGGVHTEAVTGLAIPVEPTPTADGSLVVYKTAILSARTLGDIQAAAEGNL